VRIATEIDQAVDAVAAFAATNASLLQIESAAVIDATIFA
jgi:hypothetical protein